MSTRIVATVFSFTLVFGCLYYAKNVFTTHVPVKIEVRDSNYDPQLKNHKYMCWINPDLGNYAMQSILDNIPERCDNLMWGSSTNSYVGHQFAIVDPTVKYDAETKPRVLTALTNVPMIDIRDDNFVYNPLTHFDLLVEWQKVVLSRQQVVLVMAFVFFCTALLDKFLFISTSKVGDLSKKEKGKTTAVTLVPRHLLKAYAVVAMLLNHIGHVFLKSTNLASPVFTILADAGGSLHFFNWLVGYNLAAPRSSEVWLLGAFIFLQTCVHLPPPVTYETLFSISLIRWVLGSSFMRVDPDTGRSQWGDAPIYLHALCISAVFALDSVIGAEGLKMVSMNGVMSAACGRLFALRGVEPATWYLWLCASVGLTFYSMRYSIRVVYKDLPVHQYVYGGVFVVITIVHAAVANWRSTAPQLKLSPSVNAVVGFLSTFSLEIYVAHFVLFKLILLALQ